MKTPKKTDKKAGINKTPGKEIKNTAGKPAEDKMMNSRFTGDDDDDDFDGMPLDEIDGFDELNSYDDDDDY
ncbi:hypothetical protein [Hufsiella ginkgonis]|uniref:Uncharacterized protein n=1 Tax=Hufsiella ginkgonis TaxID=2695274 RepID=A0A7K1XY73_9SPHI|nr:hypothetical protein [Hufsiella ginkgonis]MXV15954.1 hypothetical protein [Hufsiella ginkgonis]